MNQDIFSSDYEILDQTATRFYQSAERLEWVYGRLKEQGMDLEAFGWKGEGAVAFFDTLFGDDLPRLQKLINALYLSQETVEQIHQTIQNAEEDAADVFGKNYHQT